MSQNNTNISGAVTIDMHQLQHHHKHPAVHVVRESIDATDSATTNPDYKRDFCARVRGWCFDALMWQHRKIWVKLPPYLQYRIRTDAWIIRTYIWRILFIIFVMAYFQTIWARTTAFYRHRQIADYTTDPDSVFQHRLKDMGHEVAPDWSDSNNVHIVNELFQQLTAAWMVALSFVPYFFDTFVYFCKGGRNRQFNPFDYSALFTFNIVIRLLLILSVVECLRVPSYLVTSIPGPAAHCVGEQEHLDRPTNLLDAFYKPQTGANCGDLVFSGHVVLVTLAAHFGILYLPRMFGKTVGNLLSIIPCINVVCQIFLVLATRSHYSVDLVVGFIIANMAWKLDIFVYRPKDPVAPFSPCPDYVSYFDENKNQLQEAVSVETIETLKMDLSSLATLTATFPSSAVLAKAAFGKGCPFESVAEAELTSSSDVDTIISSRHHSRLNSLGGGGGAFSSRNSLNSSRELSAVGGSNMNGSYNNKNNINNNDSSVSTTMSPSEAKLFLRDDDVRSSSLLGATPSPLGCSPLVPPTTTSSASSSSNVTGGETAAATVVVASNNPNSSTDAAGAAVTPSLLLAPQFHRKREENANASDYSNVGSTTITTTTPSSSYPIHIPPPPVSSGH